MINNRTNVIILNLSAILKTLWAGNVSDFQRDELSIIIIECQNDETNEVHYAVQY